LLAERPLDAAEPLRLFERQSQAGHFQILAPDTRYERIVWHGNLSDRHSAPDVDVPRSSRSAFNQSSTSWPCSHPRAR
jgi:hypothetical protein